VIKYYLIFLWKVRTINIWDKRRANEPKALGLAYICNPSVTAVLRDAYYNIFLKFLNRQCSCVFSHFLGTSRKPQSVAAYTFPVASTAQPSNLVLRPTPCYRTLN